MSTELVLLCPDWSHLDVLRRSPLPFVLWQVGDQPLLAHWMDEAVRRGVERCTLYASDRAQNIKTTLEEGRYWSKKIEVVTLSDMHQAPPGEWVNRLPWQLPAEKIPVEPATLLRHWLEMQFAWLDHLVNTSLHLETRHPSGGWVGPHVSIHPTAQLIPPFWIGEQTKIGAHSKIGPYALIGSYCILDEKTEIEESLMLPHTYQGKYTRLHRTIAEKNVLLDCQRGCRIDIDEPFILSAAD